MAQKLASMPLAFNPGEQWAYGVSVDMQAYLVEKISGKPFDQYVRENVLDPLHMDETRYVQSISGAWPQPIIKPMRVLRPIHRIHSTAGSGRSNRAASALHPASITICALPVCWSITARLMALRC